MNDTRFNLFLASAVIKFGNNDWSLISEKLHSALSALDNNNNNNNNNNKITAEICEEKYKNLLENFEFDENCQQLPIDEAILKKLRKLRLVEISKERKQIHGKFNAIMNDKKIAETNCLSPVVQNEILKEIKKLGNNFSIADFLKIDNDSLKNENQITEQIKNKKGYFPLRNDSTMIVTINTSNISLPTHSSLLNDATRTSHHAIHRKGDSYTPSLDNHSFHLSSPCPESEIRSEQSNSIAPRINRNLMNNPVYSCMISKIESNFDNLSLKTWRKSIHLVWRQATQHKYGNVFLNPVTNEEAPGYRDIIRNPLDLNTIKRKIESGLINSTREFQRDMLLMFINAMIYNRLDQVVCQMADSMLQDIIELIYSFIDTQIRLQQQRESGVGEDNMNNVMSTRRTRRILNTSTSIINKDEDDEYNISSSSSSSIKRKRYDIYY